MTYAKGTALIFCSFILFLGLAGCQGLVANSGQPPVPTNPTSALQNSVNHIIFMMQENRSFDAYFGKLNDYRAKQGLGRTADDLESVFTNPADDGSQVANFHLVTACIYNTSAAWQESCGDMNRFDSPDGPLL